MPLTASDKETIEQIRSSGILTEVDGHMLKPTDGLIVVSCGDPDQFPEAYGYKLGVIVEAGSKARIMPVSPLGGAMRLSPNSRSNSETPGYDSNMLFDIQYVVANKGIDTIALYVHAPCAMAAHVGLDFRQIIEEAFLAKSRLKGRMPNVNVAVFCHVDYGDGRKKTYHVPKSAWVAHQRGNRQATPAAAGTTGESWARALARQYPDRVTITSSPLA